MKTWPCVFACGFGAMGVLVNLVMGSFGLAALSAGLCVYLAWNAGYILRKDGP